MKLVTALLEPEEAAKILAVHPRALLRWARRGELPAVWLSARVVRFDEADLARWIAARRTPGAGEV